MKYLIIIAFLANSIMATAQTKNFVFIQSDVKQPFYATVNGKTFGSNLNGYLIIPQLTNGSYPCKIGFPQNKFPEQQFSLQVNNTDKGYELKSFGEKGWGLYDILQFTIQMAARQTTPIDAGAVNPFATNDKAMVKEEPVKAPPVTVITPAAPVKEEKVNIPAIPPGKVSTITKTYEKAGARGIDMVFIDASSAKADTIILFVPINNSPIAIKRPQEGKHIALQVSSKNQAVMMRKEQVLL